MYQEFYRDIPGSQFFKKLYRLPSIFPQETVYRVERKTSETVLLTLSPPDAIEKKREEFKALRRFYSLGIPMPYPQDMGLCGEGRYLYMLSSDVNGEPAAKALSAFTPMSQYEFGTSAGRILRKIHSLSPRESYEWGPHFQDVTDHCLSSYSDCGNKLEEEEIFLQFIKRSRPFLYERPIRLLHGAFGPQNLFITSHQTLAVTGFSFQNGDPWTDFCMLPDWGFSPFFCSGLMDGYFSHRHIPMEFFRLTAFYLAVDTLAAFSWAAARSGEAIDAVRQRAGILRKWYQDFHSAIPSWYQSAKRGPG